MAAESQSYNGLMHAGGGTVLFLLPLSAMIPGLLPFITLAGLFTAVLVIPLLVLGLVAGLLATPPGRLAAGQTRSGPPCRVAPPGHGICRLGRIPPRPGRPPHPSPAGRGT